MACVCVGGGGERKEVSEKEEGGEKGRDGQRERKRRTFENA